MVWILEFREVVHAGLYYYVSGQTLTRQGQTRTLALELVFVRRDFPVLAIALSSDLGVKSHWYVENRRQKPRHTLTLLHHMYVPNAK